MLRVPKPALVQVERKPEPAKPPAEPPRPLPAIETVAALKAIAANAQEVAKINAALTAQLSMVNERPLRTFKTRVTERDEMGRIVALESVEVAQPGMGG